MTFAKGLGMKLKYLALILIFTLESQAQQRMELPQAPGKALNQTLQALKAQGIHRVGALDLKDFSKEAQGILWQRVSSLPPQEISARTKEPSQRKTAYYRTGNKIVTLVADLPPGTESQKSHLELHEALGALGYNDKHYVLSTALMTLKDTEDPVLRQQLLKSYGDGFFNSQNLRSSGGSSVGGGGDINAITIKSQVLQSLLKSNYRILPEFFVKYPEIGFEPFYEPSRQFVGTEYELRMPVRRAFEGEIDGANRSLPFQEMITIYFPALLWQQSPAEQAAIVKRISRVLLSLFPVHEGQGTKIFTPEGCDPSVKVSYPSEALPEFEFIQTHRTVLLNRCRETEYDKLLLSGGFTLKIPAW